MSNKEDINQLLARYFTGETLSLVQQQDWMHGLRRINRNLSRCAD